MTCMRLKRLYDEAMASGEAYLKILAKNVTKKELEAIMQCGFTVEERDSEKGKLLIINE